MSIASMRSGRLRAGGYTALELVIVMAVLGGLSILTSQSLGAVRDSTDTLATFRRAQRGGERLAYQVHSLVSSARKLFVRGTVGNDYLGALDLRRAPPSPGARLPLPEEYDPLGPDAEGIPQTGNILLLVTETDPVTCPADPATGKVLYIDVYRMMCVYPSLATRRVMTTRGEAGRDLVVWASAPYPSHAQVSGITNATERARVVRALYSTYGCRYLWNPDAPRDTAFTAIDATGTIAGVTESDHELPEDPAISPGGRLVYTKLQLAPTEPDVAQRRALLTTEPPEQWKPDGFEVKVVGASSQRKVWFRLVVEGQSTRGRDTAHDIALIASLRDL